ncbi:MAG: ribonuclease PH [Candidatus Tectomicrobia bacterium]|uniref:Ribonuclease PH n=1 Tax=Tectimicrobiota bacterium TaxID=2528274 RepID=A0A933GN22_UNCTE|nr:ribonuclease PH [Candidatus Tectomicrobia bacterium]
MRSDARKNDEMRQVQISKSYLKYAEGSAFIALGNTKVICTASIEEKVPAFLQNSGKGWVTAEYAMLPRATMERTVRESSRGKQGGRTLEIQRLIGRSLRSVVDLGQLGDRTIWIDCDVIQADGGTRTAAITGAFIALYEAVKYLKGLGKIASTPIKDYVAATSVGIVNGEHLLDLCYREDSMAEVDMNIVMTGSGRLVEVQGTAEGMPFDRNELNELLDLSEKGIRELIAYQRSILV